MVTVELHLKELQPAHVLPAQPHVPALHRVRQQQRLQLRHHVCGVALLHLQSRVKIDVSVDTRVRFNLLMLRVGPAAQ